MTHSSGNRFWMDLGMEGLSPSCMLYPFYFRLMSKKNNIKLIVGIIVGFGFIYLAFRKVDFSEMFEAFRTADYRYVLLAILVLMVSHYLRALRWSYLLAPIKSVNSGSLFSALVIGYAANTFVPAHLGEFLRAFVVGKKHRLSMGATFATIVIERIVDVFSLVALMLTVIFIHPFPEWVVTSGYIMLAGAIVLFFILLLLRVFGESAVCFLNRLLVPFPGKIKNKVLVLLDQFISGVVPLKKAGHYAFVFILSVAIWGCYALVYYFCMHSFNFIEVYQLPRYASLVVLVITTISIVVPSSPGYVGTYHYLCQVSLLMFGVPAGAALSYATIAHAVNVLPVAPVGLVLANYEGVAIYRMSAEERAAEQPDWNYSLKSETQIRR